MGVEQFVHVVIGGLGTEVLVDLHHGRVLVGGRQTESLAELVVLVETLMITPRRATRSPMA